MNGPEERRPDYGNWVPAKLIYIPGLLGVAFAALGIVHPLFVLGGIPFLGLMIYFTYARRQFSPRGGNLEARIRDLLLDHLDWDGEGEALDIGCGNGPLAAAVASKYPSARVTGIDTWGGMWDYSEKACMRNVILEGVGDRVTFEKASAASLPFDTACFDAVVSNLVFHSVAGTNDKRELLKEALRVVKKGGKFSFQDLFQVDKLYGNVDEMLRTMRGWGVESVGFVDTSGAAFIPRALKHPMMVGGIGIIHGTK